MTQGTLRKVVMYVMLLGHVAAIFMTPLLIKNFSEALDVSAALLPVTGAIIMFIVSTATAPAAAEGTVKISREKKK